MKLTCRPHAAPQPPEPTVELFLHQIADSTVRIFATGRCGIVAIEHDGERFVVTPLGDTRIAGELADQPRPSALLEVLRPIIEAARRDHLYCLSERAAEAAIAAFDAADKQPVPDPEMVKASRAAFEAGDYKTAAAFICRNCGERFFA